MKQGRCHGCQKLSWVNSCTLKEKYLGEFCADCFERIAHDKPERNRTSSDSGQHHNNPAFDNVVRALEE